MDNRLKSIIAVFIAAYFVVALSCFFLNTNKNQPVNISTPDNNIDISIAGYTMDKENVIMTGIRAKTYGTLNGMVLSAGLIVKGTAGKVITRNELGITTEFIVEVSLQEIDSNVIKIVQLKCDKLLKEGEDYVLVLEKEFYDDNTYHILGGNQGIFKESKSSIERAG
ncbi:MAG: hypothetical protein K0R05_175 [Anaerocolumna sp.]|jgi:hypothetical protein|nr:hypothetical protein [Anaerocolumna sp.]